MVEHDNDASAQVDKAKRAREKRLARYAADPAYRERSLAKSAAYHAANKEKIAARKALHREANREKIAAKRAAHYAANREKIAEQRRGCGAAYYAANKEKVRARGAAYYAANREKTLKKQAAYRKANKEKVRAYHKAWNIANQEKERARQAAHYAANRDQIKARHKAYNKANYDRKANTEKMRNYRAESGDKIRVATKARYEANPEKFKAYCANRRAARMSVPGSYTSDEIKELFERQKGRCAYSRVNPRCLGKITLERGKPNSCHRDHIIPLTRPGSTNWITNIQLTCKHCNTAKKADDPIDFAQGLGLLL